MSKKINLFLITSSFIMVFLYASLSVSAQSQLIIIRDTLTTSDAMDTVMRSGESHQYTVWLNTGEYLKVHIQQYDADLMALTYKPDGKVLETINEVPDGIAYMEISEIKADTSGYYRYLIQPVDSSVLECKYSIQVVEKLSAIQYQKRLIEEKTN